MDKEHRPASSVIAEYIHQQIIQRGISYDLVAEKLGRARSYAALRISGKKAWDTRELDVIAEMLHYSSAFALVNAARQSEIKKDPATQREEPHQPQRRPLPPEIRAEIDDLEARLSRSLERYNSMKDYEVVADRSEREDEEWFD